MRRIVIPSVLLLGCSIPDTQFKPSPGSIPAPVTDVAKNNTVTLEEGQSVDVNVHLSNPPGADVNVMVLLGNGPVSAVPSLLMFTEQNYATDQVVRFTATSDANIVSEDQPLTLRMGALDGFYDSVDKSYKLHIVDRDALNILVSPPMLTIHEGTTRTFNVALTQQPTANVPVTVTRLSGHIEIDTTLFTFTPQNFANQIIQVLAFRDADTENYTDTVTLSAMTAGVAPRDVTVSIIDDGSFTSSSNDGGVSCSVAGAGSNSGWAGIAMLTVAFLGLRWRRPRVGRAPRRPRRAITKISRWQGETSISVGCGSLRPGSTRTKRSVDQPQLGATGRQQVGLVCRRRTHDGVGRRAGWLSGHRAAACPTSAG